MPIFYEVVFGKGFLRNKNAHTSLLSLTLRAKKNMAVIRLLIFICMLGISRTEKVDSTLEVGVSGAEAVRSVLNKLEHKHFFNLPSGLTDSSQVTEQFMREMAYVASQDGERPSSNDVKGGIWRVDETIFKATQSYNYSSVYQRVCEAFCIDWATVSYKDLSKPFYSGLAVAIYMYHLETVGNGLPVEALDRTKAVFWLTFFQSNQHLSVSIWFLYVAQLRRIEGKVHLPLLCVVTVQCHVSLFSKIKCISYGKECLSSSMVKYFIARLLRICVMSPTYQQACDVTQYTSVSC